VVLRTFRWSFLATAAVLVGALLIGGPEVAAIVAILAILEISLSFDNAVVNATVLERMRPEWQRIFLTVGIAIAVFGMRLLFPLLVVGVTADLNPVTVIDLAVNRPDEYAAHLTNAHPAIAAFGGIFLAMIFLDFVFEAREVTWLGPLERALAKVGKLDQLSVVIGIGSLLVLSFLVDPRYRIAVLVAGTAGIATYVAVSSLAALFGGGKDDGDVVPLPPESDVAHIKVPGALAKGGLFSFLYLEVLDASFSFDGVVGAFAITQDIFIIAAGLGIGAMYIRSLTVFLVRKGALAEYVHLEHGAHYAIGALALILFASIEYDVPEILTGVIGVGFITVAFATSIAGNRQRSKAALAALVDPL